MSKATKAKQNAKPAKTSVVFDYDCFGCCTLRCYGVSRKKHQLIINRSGLKFGFMQSPEKSPYPNIPIPTSTYSTTI